MSEKTDGPKAAKVPGKESLKAPLPKRFYASAEVSEAGPGFRVTLDGRPVRTPGKRLLVLPSRDLAEALAAEWRAQGERIDPATMPITRIVNSALDAVAGQEGVVAADAVAYAGSDLLCYRAEGPDGLVDLQERHWQPVVAWAERELGARLTLVQGVVPVAQSERVLAAVGAALAPLDAIALSAVHVVTTLTGSALLAVAVLRGRLTAQEAWQAAHVDEDWQIAQWGEDEEAAARRAYRWLEMAAACRILALVKTR